MSPPLGAALDLGPAYERRLRDAGVDSLEGLARADVPALAVRTRIPEARIREWVELARARLEAPAAVAAAPASPVGSADRKVVISRGGKAARVKVGDRWLENLPIVTVKLQEGDETMRALEGNVVVLREKSSLARVRVDGTWHEQVPIFEARPKGAVTEEVRVRVHEIVDR